MLTIPLTMAPEPIGVAPSKKFTAPAGRGAGDEGGEGRGEDRGVVEEDGVDGAGDPDVDDVEDGLEDGVGGCALVVSVTSIDSDEGEDAPGALKWVTRVVTPPLRVPVPMVTPLLLKVTVPVGVPVVDFTVAVRVVLALTFTGLTELESVAVVA